jgi:hypothetical protein
LDHELLQFRDGEDLLDPLSVRARVGREIFFGDFPGVLAGDGRHGHSFAFRS